MAMSKTRAQFPLSPKKILKNTMSGTFAGAILAAFAIFVLASLVNSSHASARIATMAPLIVAGYLAYLLLLFIVMYVYQRWYFAVYFYDLTNDYLIIRKGPITPREITIPYERIQDVYVDQDILDRIFGLYDVHVSSATVASGMEAHIDGVDRQTAEGLRAAVLRKVEERITKK